MRSCLQISAMAKGSLVAACLAVGLASQVYGAAVTAPYSDNFTYAPGNASSNFGVALDRSSATSTWTTTAGGVQHAFSDGSWGVATSVAYLSLNNLGGSNTNDFSITTTVTSAGTNNEYRGRTGLFAFSNTTNMGWGQTSFYAGEIVLGYGAPSAINIVHGISTDYPTPDATASFPGLTADTTYTMALSGHYTTAGVTLTFTVSNPNDSAFTPVSVSCDIPASAIPSGNMFGIRDDVQGGAETLNYGNFSINTVPEPVSLGLIGLGAMGLIARRRKLA